MSDPRRWLEAGSPASPEIRRWLSAGRPPERMSSRDYRLSEEKVERLLTRSEIPLHSLPRGRILAVALVIVLVCVTALAAAMGLFEAASSGAPPPEQPTMEQPPPKQRLSGQAPSARGVDEQSPSGQAPNEPPPPGQASSPPARPTGASSPPSTTPESPAVEPPPAPRSPEEAQRIELEEEVQLLDKARAARSNDPASALRLLAEHALRFPHGKLGFDRELLTIDALRASGRVPEARARAESLLERAKGKPHEEKLRRLVESLQ